MEASSKELLSPRLPNEEEDIPNFAGIDFGYSDKWPRVPRTVFISNEDNITNLTAGANNSFLTFLLPSMLKVVFQVLNSARSLPDLNIFKSYRNRVTYFKNQVKQAFYTNFIDENSTDHKRLFRATKQLLAKKEE